MEALLATGEGTNAVGGFLIAVLSCFFNGTFPVCTRLQKKEVHPVVYNFLVCIGVFLSSLPVPLIAQVPYIFSLGDSAGGSIFVFAALFSFVAIPFCGRAGPTKLATAQAVWSCSAILVSVAWGIFGPRPQIGAPVSSAVVTALAVVVLLAGALTAVSCEAIAKRLFGRRDDFPLAAGEAPKFSEATLGATGGSHTSSSGSRLLGLMSAASVGLFGGSVLVPLKLVPGEESGLAALPSFGIGALVTGLLVVLVYMLLIKRDPKMLKVPLDSLLSGMLSGLIWNLGNVCSIIAMKPPFSLSYGIAYTILQCAMVFGGIWGIYVFREITGKAVLVFWLGALILVLGVVLLALFGPNSG